MTKVAILYDFDKTLCGKDMQEYSLIPSLGYENPKDFWKEVTSLAHEHNMMRLVRIYIYCRRSLKRWVNHLQNNNLKA